MSDTDNYFCIFQNGSNQIELKNRDGLSLPLYAIIYDGDTSNQLADDATLEETRALPFFGILGVEDDEEHAGYFGEANAAAQRVASTAYLDDADTDNYFCIYDAGTSVNYKNRLGSAKYLNHNTI